MKTYKGKFKPKNPQKYKGDPTNIVYRSSWELKLMFRLDDDPSVVSWGSEEIVIPYISPIDGKVHRYFVDFIVTRINSKGIKNTILIEVKPKSQTQPPKVPSKKTKKYLNEVFTWGVNEAKWKYATEYCKDRGWEFVIMTEVELNIKF